MSDSGSSFFDIIPNLAGWLGLIVIGTLLWGASKKMESNRNDIKNLEKKHVEDINALNAKHAEDMKSIELKIEQKTTERNELINKTVGNQKEEFVAIDKRMTEQASDVKTLLARIEVNETKIKASEEVHLELKERDDKNFQFFTQAIRDLDAKIEKLREEFLHMFAAFHSHTDKTKE